MYPRIDFLYLSEPAMIHAGVLNAAACVSVCEETFGLLGKGDYLMGGPNHNHHGISITFPPHSAFPNMPMSGPDRRFAAMPGYLGGRFDVCGNKWYGSNHANAKEGLPRSILTMMLNDKQTGAPLALMSANLLSAARTGAVAGVGAKHLANRDARVISVVGCGPINKACLTALMTQLPSVKKIVCFDIILQRAENFARWAEKKYDVSVVGVSDAEPCFRDGDVITVAASRAKPLYFKDEWIKEGATILVSGPFNTDDSFLTNCKIVFDHTPMHRAYLEEGIASGDKEAYYSGEMGGPFYRLLDAGKLPALEEATGLGDVVNCIKPGRLNFEERIIFISCGMSVFDIAWGFDVYKTAAANGIGTLLNLWHEPSGF
ncbi:tyramine oxidase subunit B [Paraburkholderia sabiae]|uniref:Tyramine oxidase subunit B n=1 Tax=Paraburkholderia sabiae TaxID=273251 RepID=A0ABU9QLC0_9BURK|nr:tyramine oxidase subunit B [Paraburkholderia sabiae]WJZ79266.1 tyramine oxidase subunit B [Paraburkholderia sabiae]CAD6560766.1 N-((2S)-2-amino-2-carboxyethyl)-L-glutamate dehydrogenase [Paraburkholderia sabiae]